MVFKQDGGWGIKRSFIPSLVTTAFFLHKNNVFLLRIYWFQFVSLSFGAASFIRHGITNTTVATTWSRAFTVENDQDYDDGNYHNSTARNPNN